LGRSGDFLLQLGRGGKEGKNAISQSVALKEKKEKERSQGQQVKDGNFPKRLVQRQNACSERKCPNVRIGERKKNETQ